MNAKKIGLSILNGLLAVLSFMWRGLRAVYDLATQRFTNTRRFKVEETVCYSVHPSFYMWALILLGWAIAPIMRHLPSWNVDLTWLYLWTLFYAMIMLLFDLGTLRLVITTVVIALIVMTVKYVELARNVAVISHIVLHFVNMRPMMNAGVPSTISWMLFFPWIVTLIESYRSGRKSFSPNGIEERNLLVGREITDRSGLHFSCKYPDLLETLLGFGSGSVVAYDSSNKAVKEWHNIIGLYFKWNRLDEILHQRSAVVDNAPCDPVEVEDVKK